MLMEHYDLAWEIPKSEFEANCGGNIIINHNGTDVKIHEHTVAITSQKVLSLQAPHPPSTWTAHSLVTSATTLLA